MHCALCRKDLPGDDFRSAPSLGDCHPLCAGCLGSLGKRFRPGRRTLVRSLYAAGRSISACQACGALGAAEFHFLLPLARGGTAESRNLLVLCPACHDKAHRGARIGITLDPRSDSR
jgi:5-methylcytosine-specific restriction endonuclease McrA